MTLAAWGVVLGGFTGLGIWIVADRVLASRHTSLALRVAPYLRDLPTTPRTVRPVATGSAFSTVFGPVLRRAAELVEKVLGGSSSVARRLERSRSTMTVHDFRVSQAVWGLAGFSAAAVPASLVALGAPERALPLMIMCLCAFAQGVLLRENPLTAQVTQRERQVLAEHFVARIARQAVEADDLAGDEHAHFLGHWIGLGRAAGRRAKAPEEHVGQCVRIGIEDHRRLSSG